MVNLVLCNATQALAWKFLFPREILCGTMHGHVCKCEGINEWYCSLAVQYVELFALPYRVNIMAS